MKDGVGKEREGIKAPQEAVKTKLSLAARNSFAPPLKFRASGKYAEGATLEFNHYASRPAAPRSAHAALSLHLRRRIVGQLVTHKFRTAEYSYEPSASRWQLSCASLSRHSPRIVV